MDLQKAVQLLGEAVENPEADVTTRDLALAAATVLIRSQLVGLTLDKQTITVITEA